MRVEWAVRSLPSLTLAAALAVGLVAGVFFGFSTFVMRGLSRLPTDQGASAMREINVAAVGPGFMAAFMGATLLSLALMVVAVLRRGEDGMALLLAGSLLYLLGSFGVTAALNVPLNDALARDASTWPSYLGAWTTWNHVRTLASAVAFALLVLSAVQQSAGSSPKT